MFKHINQINEQSFLIDFGSEIDIKINYIVNLYSGIILNDIKKIKELKILNCVPSYNKILIQFDPIYSNKNAIIKYIKSIKINKKQINKKVNTVEIPICYDKQYSLDLEEISKITKLSKKKIINEHLKILFHVFMIGFLPGLPFTGFMSSKFSLERKLTPRTKVPKGSVGLVNRLCVIYPQESPGGWNIIGRTPIDLFSKNKREPLLVYPGDKIKFKKISNQEFLSYE